MSDDPLFSDRRMSFLRGRLIWLVAVNVLSLSDANAADAVRYALKLAIKAARYVFTSLDLPGYKTLEGISINADGAVLVRTLSKRGATHDYIYREGQYSERSITPPGASAIAPRMINDTNMITGTYLTDEINDQGIPVARDHGFLFDSGTTTPFDAPNGGLHVEPWGINAQGQVVGEFQDIETTHFRGFTFQDGRFDVIDQPGASDTRVSDVNDFGVIVGHYQIANEAHGFIRTGDATESFDSPPEDSAVSIGHRVQSINNAGAVLGQCYFFQTELLHRSRRTAYPVSDRRRTRRGGGGAERIRLGHGLLLGEAPQAGARIPLQTRIFRRCHRHPRLCCDACQVG